MEHKSKIVTLEAAEAQEGSKNLEETTLEVTEQESQQLLSDLSADLSADLAEYSELDWHPLYPTVEAELEARLGALSGALSKTLVPGLPPQTLPDEPTEEERRKMSASLEAVMNSLTQINGFVAAAIASAESGMSLAAYSADPSFNVEVAAAANTEVVRAKHSAMQALQLDGAVIEDILITLNTQYHLIRPSQNDPLLFIYLAVDRKKANLALARHALGKAEADLNI